MKKHDEEIANQFGLYDRIKSLEDALLAVDGVVEVEFDLCGFLDNIRQVIIIPKYNIPVKLENYYEVRRQHLNNILKVTRDFGLLPSGDRIEDYGEHWYIVRDCDESWKIDKVL